VHALGDAASSRRADGGAQPPSAVIGPRFQFLSVDDDVLAVRFMPVLPRFQKMRIIVGVPF